MYTNFNRSVNEKTFEKVLFKSNKISTCICIHTLCVKENAFQSSFKFKLQLTRRFLFWHFASLNLKVAHTT